MADVIKNKIYLKNADGEWVKIGESEGYPDELKAENNYDCDDPTTLYIAKCPFCHQESVFRRTKEGGYLHSFYKMHLFLCLKCGTNMTESDYREMVNKHLNS